MILNFLKTFIVDGKRKQTDFEKKIKTGIKLHTIRHDASQRWISGCTIHFSTGSRTNNYHCFKMGECVSTQRIVIRGREIWVDGKEFLLDEVEWLAINDGFENIEDFWAWFDQYSPFEGKIIHWTNLKYDYEQY